MTVKLKYAVVLTLDAAPSATEKSAIADRLYDAISRYRDEAGLSSDDDDAPTVYLDSVTCEESQA